jgi:hypothetical protein
MFQKEQKRQQHHWFTRNVSNIRETSIRKPSGTYRTPATAIMPATVWMQATAGTQAATVTPATSNINDDSNIMTAHNSKNASNSRNVSNNRMANTYGRHKKLGCFQKQLCRQQHGGRPTAAETRGTSQPQQQKGDPSEWQKFMKKDVKKCKNSPIFVP